MTFKKIILLGSIILFTACNLLKKSSPDSKIPPISINLDTIETVASLKKEEKYQSTATRLNDVIHTKLDVRFDWKKQYLYGKATIKVKPYFYPTNTLLLDAQGMELKEVSLITDAPNKLPLTYTYKNDVITVQLDKEYKNTEEYTVFIDYVSKPNELKSETASAAITDDKGLYFINADGQDKNKPQEIWTQGETQSSSVWFPTIDRPNERMTQEIYITVNKKFVTLSNGELVSSFDNGDSTRTDHWKMELPHAPYLAMMAIGDFAIVKDNWRGKEVSYYVEKEYEKYARSIFGRTPEMIEFFSNKLGVEYPWNKYSQVVARDYVSGAMENTTATLHSEYLQRTDRELLDKDYEHYVSHELFHQWFGDLVTCESWSNIPLNESFATYGEYLWKEFAYGLDDADFHSAESRAGYFAEAENKQVDLIRFNYEKQGDMFDAHSYNKGGQIIHMLRKYVGDEAFFTTLKLYLETNKFTSVEIHNLRLAFEKITGEDLNWFFNQWFLASGHPNLVIETEYDATNKKQKVHIQQTQDFSKTPLFKIPMYIDLYVSGKVERKKITMTKAFESFEFDAAIKPDLVNVDAEKMLLCTKTENKSIAEWAFQYNHAPLYLDRQEALVALNEHANDSIAAKTIIAALNDKFWNIRINAIIIAKQLSKKYEKEIKQQLITLAKSDKKAVVRATAIDYLSEQYKDDVELESVYKDGLKDSSYNVVCSALAAISKTNPQKSIELAKTLEHETNTDVLYTITVLYANFGSDDNNSFFLNNVTKFTDQAKIAFVAEYGVFLKKAQKQETINKGVDLLAQIAKEESHNKWIVYYTKKGMKELVEACDNKINANQQAPSDIESWKLLREKIIGLFNAIP